MIAKVNAGANRKRLLDPPCQCLYAEIIIFPRVSRGSSDVRAGAGSAAGRWNAGQAIRTCEERQWSQGPHRQQKRQDRPVYRGGSGLRGGSGARGYPGSTTKPGSTTIIRAYKPQKGRKARPATERGTAARGRQHPSPARGGPVAPAPQARRAIPARKWQLTRKSGHVATTIRTPRAYPPPLRGLWGLSY